MLGGRNYAKYTVLKYVLRSKASERVNFRHKMNLKGGEKQKIGHIWRRIVTFKESVITTLIVKIPKLTVY